MSRLVETTYNIYINNVWTDCVAPILVIFTASNFLGFLDFCHFLDYWWITTCFNNLQFPSCELEMITSCEVTWTFFTTGERNITKFTGSFECAIIWGDRENWARPGATHVRHASKAWGEKCASNMIIWSNLNEYSMFSLTRLSYSSPSPPPTPLQFCSRPVVM